MGPTTQQTPTVIQIQRVIASVSSIFIGKQDVVLKALTTFLAGGHLLIEDVPGVGKTTLALALARSLGCTFQRIQFTSDLLPSDILGVSVLEPKTQEFKFKFGPLFHQIILADELNRATPRTQSALLEAMNEHQVTIDNTTHALPWPFFVIGTQNPHEHHGAFPLPESQLDRFMMRLSIGYPSAESEQEILSKGVDMESIRQLNACLSPEDVLSIKEAVSRIHVSDPVNQYILAIIHATRHTPRVEVGASTRAAVAIRKAVQAHALLDGRDYTQPDDVKALAIPVLAHRLILTSDQISDARKQTEQIIQGIIDQTPVPL